MSCRFRESQPYLFPSDYPEILWEPTINGPFCRYVFPPTAPLRNAPFGGAQVAIATSTPTGRDRQTPPLTQKEKSYHACYLNRELFVLTKCVYTHN